MLSLLLIAPGLTGCIGLFNPFDSDTHADYQRWRDNKLADYPTRLDELIVDVNDPRALAPDEHRALLACCKKTNFAIYRSPLTEEDKDIPARLGAQFGLHRLNHNWLADEDAITSLKVNDDGDHPRYIPYTDRPIKWHTDGYYNRADEQIHGLILHCVRAAGSGGANRLLDHDIAYIKLRDTDPQFIAALMQTDAMCIPARVDEQGVAREEVCGPVFSVHAPSGGLHMRYTARTRSIRWKQDARVEEAVACLLEVLESDMPYIFSATLQPGMGLISNNILHDRSAFKDSEDHKRLLYRARYFDRIRETGPVDV